MAPNIVGEVEGAGVVVVWRVHLIVLSPIITSVRGEAGDLLPRTRSKGRGGRRRVGVISLSDYRFIPIRRWHLSTRKRQACFVDAGAPRQGEQHQTRPISGRSIPGYYIIDDERTTAYVQMVMTVICRISLKML